MSRRAAVVAVPGKGDGAMIEWSDLVDREPAKSYQMCACSGCAHVLIRRLPEGTWHRNLEEARAGRWPICACPKCGREIAGKNWAN